MCGHSEPALGSRRSLPVSDGRPRQPRAEVVLARKLVSMAVVPCSSVGWTPWGSVFGARGPRAWTAVGTTQPRVFQGGCNSSLPAPFPEIGNPGTALAWHHV